ncbi:MAG: hypothetical protein BWX57_00354 [Tenericutes bacterium ADurb.Bin024]|nr:MAG: hypothetical protein BWX57_00354 [Tenericutes bacterium ADurb.Bin024]
MWHQAWNPGNRPIIWNYKENSSKRITENTLMETLLEVLNEAKEEVPVEEQQKETQLEKKYEITTEAFTNISGVTVYRIKSLKNFAGIQKGELGGYIESEDNLSHSGNCWVKDNAMVYSGGRVEQNALVSGISEVYNNALVTGQAKVDGNCYIYDNVKVGTDSTKDCTITGGVNVYGGSEVKSGLLTGSALVYNNSIIYDKAQIKDYAIVSNSKVGGETIIYHNAKVTDVDANGFIDIAGNSILEGPISIKGKVQIYGTSRLKGSDEGITIDATKGEIHIKDNAEVQGSPTIKGHVIIEGNAKVSDKAFIGTSISDNGNLEVKGAILKRLRNTQDYITIGGYGGANYFDENIVITNNAVVQGQASIISGGVIYNKKKKKNREYKASDIVVKTHGAKVEGNAVVKGNTIIGPGVVVTNDAILDGNIYFVNSELVDKTPTYSGVDKVIDSTLSANQDTMNTKVKEDEEPIITSEELSKNENLQLIKELYFDNDKLKEYLPEEEYKDLQKLIIRDLYNKVKIDIRLIHDTLKILETSIWGMEINKFYNADNPEQLDQLIKEFYKLAPSLIIRLNKVAEIAKAAFDKLDSNKISKLDKDKKIDLFLYNRTLVDIIKLTKGLIN